MRVPSVRSPGGAEDSSAAGVTEVRLRKLRCRPDGLHTARTPRLHLVSARADDMARYRELASDPEAQKWLGWPLVHTQPNGTTIPAIWWERPGRDRAPECPHLRGVSPGSSPRS